VSLQLFAHPFSSYCWKVLIPLYADETPFDYRMLDEEHAENFAELQRRWPFAKFPVLVDGGRTVAETSPIIEHLQTHHRGPNDWIPDGELGRRVRFLDRFFDLYVMNNMQKIGTDPLRPDGSRDEFGVEVARKDLNTAYDWLEEQLPADGWFAGDFSLVECAAAPSLFYADWVEEIGDGRPKLKAYRARLLAHAAVSRCVEEARPYRPLFPRGAPDRD